MPPAEALLAPPLLPASSHAAMLARRLGEPLIAGNRVELLQDGPATFEAMHRAIDAATDHINVEGYIVDGTGLGEALAERLIARRRDGLRVNLLFDSFGSIGTSAAFFERLREAGINLCEANPVQRWRAWLGRALHLCEHRKLMIVDGRVGFIGGVDIGRVHPSALPRTGDRREAGRRDLHLRVEGPVVLRLQQLFVRHWQQHARCAMQMARYFPPLAALGPQRVALAASDAGRRRNSYDSALLGAIDTARSRILLTTAYLVPPRRLINALLRAARRGVAVELLLPGIGVWAPLHAGRSHYSQLLRAGVRIHERHDRLLHAKACVIDGVWSSVGSSNADWRSVLHKAEADLVVLDHDFAGRLEQVFRDDVVRATTVEPQAWARRSRWQRCREALARRCQFFL